MRVQSAHGSLRRTVTQPDSNGFVNRRSSVQSRPPAQASQSQEFTKESAQAAVDGYLDGKVSARRATAALAWQLRKPLTRDIRLVAAGKISASEARKRTRALADRIEAAQ